MKEEVSRELTSRKQTGSFWKVLGDSVEHKLWGYPPCWGLAEN